MKKCRKTTGWLGKLSLCVVLLTETLLCAAVFATAAYSASAPADRLAVVSQPQDYTASLNGSFYFSVDANMDDVTYLWQFSEDGGEKWYTSSVKLREYSSKATEEKEGNLYRCVITAPDGSSVTSAAAKLTISRKLGFITQPKAYTGEFRDEVLFEVQAGGTNLKYQWEISSDGTDWTPVSSSGKTQRYKTTVLLSTVGKYFRCVIMEPTGANVASVAVRILLNSSGFVDYNGARFYMYYDGTIPTGLTEIDGMNYYFSNSGTALTGYFKINGELYHFDGEAGVIGERFIYNSSTHLSYFIGRDGKARKGWIDHNGKKYYCCNEGYMSRGMTVIDGSRYYFDFETGEQKTGLIRVGLDALMYFNGDGGRAVSGMKTINAKTYYFSDAKESFGVAMSGFLTLDGGKYYFLENRTLNTTEGFFTNAGNIYYSDKNGRCVTGFKRIGGKLYLFGDDGVMITGKQTINGDTYLFADSGAAVTGWYDDEDGNRYYYLPESGKLAKDNVTVDGETYYLNESGSLRTGRFYAGGRAVYYAPDYQEFSGWMDVSGKQCYVNPDHTFATGIQIIDGKKYYFNSSGFMQTGFFMLDGGRYYFSPYAVYGFQKLENGRTCYFCEDGSTLTGLQKIDGKLYCFNDIASLLYGFRTIDGKRYFFDENSGAARTGWMTITSKDGSWQSVYLDPETFCARTGLTQIDGETYYFGTTGFMETGYLKLGDVVYYFDDVYGNAYTGFLYVSSKKHVFYFDGARGALKGPAMHRINGRYYCFDAYGYLRTGIVTLDGKRYYFDPQSGALRNGFFRDGENTYYCDGLNGILTGRQTIDGNDYYLGTSGKMIFGSVSVDGKRCFFDKNTGVQTYGLVKNDEGVTYCLLENGTSGAVVRYGGVDYNIAESGTLKKGYLSTVGMYFDQVTGERHFGLITVTLSDGSDRTYYFSEAGMSKSVAEIRGELDTLKQKDGWKDYRSERYYVKNGDFLKGVQKLKGADGKTHTYYFSSLSGAMLTGLRNVGGDEYLFDPATGEMLTGARECDGRAYYFDPSSGKGPSVWSRRRTAYIIICPEAVS